MMPNVDVNSDRAVLPRPKSANRELYERYQALANNESDVIFVGRLASYKYFNMDQAFLNALEIFDDVMGICGGENENHEKITSEGDGPITLAR